ncbi:MAG: hypothetical protein LBN96_08365 [Desulfovibrio sp.]|jgi:hypothetical protein|nr:hypothetical protein [Desulfovibrio sp.]
MLDYYRYKSVSELMAQNKPDEARLLLAELQRRYVSVCDENAALRTQIQEFDDILYIARNLVIERGFYWLITGAVRQGPFCPTCCKRDGLLVRLVGDRKGLICSNCRGIFPSLRHKPEAAAMASPDCIPGTRASGPEYSAGKAKVLPFRR